jgi:Protein of unknown function (DUF2652)/Polyketide cyclase / dehydrase and lipid transport
MATEPACLLIADISGYTSYLVGVELDHAQEILADLMRTIVTALRPSFRLAKLEGDAAFVYVVTEQIDGSLLLDTIERCYFGFRRRRRDVRQATSCPCRACTHIPDLNLKFVVHHGTILRQEVAGGEELVGSDVIVVHRLLKNEVVASTSIEAYALFTQQCVDAMDVDVAALGMRSTSETYEHIGEVPAWVHDLGRRWEEEEARTRVIVDRSQAVSEWEIPTSAPPQVAWEFITTPGRRLTWTPGMTGVECVAPGNRRGVGAVNHCMHGRNASIEELLDWRPYDYFSLRNTIHTPAGPVSFLQTTEFEPTPDGTIVHMRTAAPDSLRERVLLRLAGRMMARAFKAAEVALTEQIRTELERRAQDASPEPDLPASRADGVLSGALPNPQPVERADPS